MVANASPAKVTFYGRTLTNLLGSNGNFENNTPNIPAINGGGRIGSDPAYTWGTTGSNVYAGTYAAQYTSSTSGFAGYKLNLNNSIFTTGKYYLLGAYIKNENNAIQLQFQITKNNADYINVGRPEDFTSYGVAWTTVAMAAVGFNYYPLKFQYNGETQMKISFTWQGGNQAIRSFQIDNMCLYEVDASTYAKIGVDAEYTDAKLSEKFPYVDGNQHTQGVSVKKVGRNLLPPLTNINWGIPAEAVVTDPYSLVLTPTAASRTSYVRVPAFPNTTYTVSVNSTNTGSAGRLYWETFDAMTLGNKLSSEYTAGVYKKTFTTPANTVSILVAVDNAAATTGTFNFWNMQLEYGSIATTFTPYNEDLICLPTNLASNVDGTIIDSAYEKEGQWYKWKRWQTGVILDGLVDWRNYPNDAPAGSKRAYYNQVLPTSRASYRLTKYDGMQVPKIDVAYNTEGVVLGTDNYLHVSVPHAATGFSDAFVPAQADWKNYFNGWKVNNGTVGTAYPGTGTKYYTPIVLPKANFIGKIDNSAIECPHFAIRGQGTTLRPGPTFGGSEDQARLLAYLDGNSMIKNTSASNDIPQIVFQFNLIEHVLRKHGAAIFGSAVTTADRVTWLKTNISQLRFNWYGYGFGPAGNKVYLYQWGSSSNQWWSSATHSNNTISKLTVNPTSANMADRVDANGFVYFLACADASDGTILSQVLTDNVDLEVELNTTSIPSTGLSSVEFIPYKLDYVLSSPYEELIPDSEGAIFLNSGNNHIELMEGIILKEKVTPQFGAPSYYINLMGPYQLKNKVGKILKIYKYLDGILTEDTNNWGIGNTTSAYGIERAFIDQYKYNTGAEYYVTYVMLDRHTYTCNAIEAKVEYQSSARNVVSELTQREADTKSLINSSTKSLAELYKRIKSLGG